MAENIIVSNNNFGFSRLRIEKPNPYDFYTHIHTRYEFYYFISGKGTFIVLYFSELLILS